MKINDSVIKIDDTVGAYCYAVILDSKDVILIDSSLPNKQNIILDELKNYNIDKSMIKAILLTHHDVDHIGSCKAIQDLTDCEIYIHQNDLPYVLEQKEREGVKAGRSKELGIEIPNNIKPFNSNHLFGIEIIESFGHTPGHCCFKYQDVLFIGDLVRVKNDEIIPMEEKYVLDLPKSFDSCLNLPITNINWLCPAHGEPIECVYNWNAFLKQYILKK